jgi:hypothetical protein
VVVVSPVCHGVLAISLPPASCIVLITDKYHVDELALCKTGNLEFVFQFPETKLDIHVSVSFTIYELAEKNITVKEALPSCFPLKQHLLMQDKVEVVFLCIVSVYLMSL